MKKTVVNNKKTSTIVVKYVFYIVHNGGERLSKAGVWCHSRKQLNNYVMFDDDANAN